jgi:UDP-glucose 4-epimerase
MTKQLKVLVTGSEGYIGKHLCHELKKYSCYEIHRLDKHFEEGTDLTNCYELDIRRPQDIRKTMLTTYEFDVIVHLAALVRVGESVDYPTAYYNTNINGTNWLRNIVPHKKFIFSSTGAAEGMASPYAISKKVAEDMLREQEPDTTIFRFYNVIGSKGFPPTNPDGLFFNLIQAVETGKFTIYGDDYDTKDGTCVREYVHVTDICQALMRAFVTPSKDHIENLAYGDTRTVKEIVEIFKQVNVVDFDIEYKPRRPGDLEACYLEHPSKFMSQNYSYEDMLKWKP